MTITDISQGLWWLPTAAEAHDLNRLPGTTRTLAAATGGVDGDGGGELLQMAAAQRMNTETRRAVFCVVMGSQDYIDASEKLLRLPLKVSTMLQKLSVHDNVQKESIAADFAETVDIKSTLAALAHNMLE